MPAERVDAVVLGAGPAGATLALNLAPFRRVMVLEREAKPTARIGESLPAVAGRLLADMGLWEGFVADGHLPCFARRSIWGAPGPMEVDSLRDPDGPGWHLHRARFEGQLRAVAQGRGAVLYTPATAHQTTRCEDGWRVAWTRDGQCRETHCRILVEARGRSGRPPGAAGGRRIVADRLICAWLVGREDGVPSAGITYTEAEPDGWWYTAPLPGGRRMLGFHTDADLAAAREARHRASLLARAAAREGLAAALRNTRFAPDAQPALCAAHGARLDSPAGADWFAVGDAALACDPLSAQGLLTALYTGLAAAEAIDRLLAGHTNATAEYCASVDAVWRAYEAHRAAWYGQEGRWPDAPFWARRMRRREG